MNINIILLCNNYTFFWHNITDRKSGLETLIGSPPSIKSEEESSCRKRPEHSPINLVAGTKRPLVDEDDSSTSPSKTIKTEMGDGDRDGDVEDETATTSDG